eukprot:Rmarinus@m.23829
MLHKLIAYSYYLFQSQYNRPMHASGTDNVTSVDIWEKTQLANLAGERGSPMASSHANGAGGDRFSKESSAHSGRKRRLEGDDVAPPESSRKEEKKRRRTSRSPSSAVRHREQLASKYADDEGHCRVEIGDTLGEEYKVQLYLGEGTFGKVYDCRDRKNNRFAVKVIKNIEKYRYAAKIELKVLDHLKKHDPKNDKPLIHLIRHFEHHGHVCLVFEYLGFSLFDFLKKNKFRPFQSQTVRSIARQLFEGVAYMHDLGLVHTDLKPENVLFRSDTYHKRRTKDGGSYRTPLTDKIAIIDFGGTTFEEDYHSSIVSTRHYRAPEVILGMGWSYPCDIWSLGCIIIELYTGEALFRTHDNQEHLAMMEKAVGKPFPLSFIRRADKHGRAYFVPDDEPASFRDRRRWGGSSRSRVRFPRSSTKDESIEAVDDLSPLKNMLRTKRHSDFLDFLLRTLEYDPKYRITAREALHHPYLRDAPLPADVPPGED